MIFNAIRLDRSEAKPFVRDRDMQFLAYCLARRARSKAQILQDLWVCFELGEKRGGYFVEFGATNGLKNSNTWLLENELGWSGILAEPNPFWHADLAANRGAAIEHRCVSAKSGERVSFITTDDTDPELSAIADFSDGDHFAERRARAARIEVETISLDDLLDHYGAPTEIDYISIDTEGSEMAILSAYSFRHRFQLISVESNAKNEAPLDALLTAKGYVRVFRQFSQWDGWYVAAERLEGAAREVAAPEA
ncbi:FkbM family methyltransferase [Novosphingobium profundi]|uniref:FkbM family methyltransferase n=1 Tax=Novosphingobium profundi TaxID=1774954 RepID=UPI001BDA4293|nr:FkbM family methyltransferase [Novosphingobium profundi]